VTEPGGASGVGPASRAGGRISERLRRSAASVSLTGRLVVGSVLISLLVAASFTLLLLAMAHLRSSTNQQARSKDVTAATLGLERVVNQLEVSLRTFVISDDERFLGSWRAARRNLSPALVALETAVADQPVQQSDVGKLATLIRDYVSEYGLPLIAIARVSPEVARAPVATREGVVRIDAVRNGLARLQASEDRLATLSSRAARSEAARAVEVGVGALVLTGGLLLAFGIFLNRGIAQPVRTAAAGASRVAAGDLSTRLPEVGAAEILDLSRSFNAMARSLEQSKRELETQNEQLRQSERLKSELVSIVSHELRTPLASIMGYASLLLKRDFRKADAERYLEVIHGQGSRLSSLVEDFLDVESVEAGRLELKNEPVDLKQVLNDEAELVAKETTRHRIEVVTRAESLPVRGDHDRLAQVYGNLLTNAIKYSPNGGLVEVVGTISNGSVRVEVHDEGIGIPAEHQPRIFTKFFRGEARDSGIAGSGLGLTMSREIIEAHGGRIGFTSNPGLGSVFWFELPLESSGMPAVNPS
jgi:signal transduction histidine kinase